MRKFGKQLLAGPYLVWIIGFIILPVFAVLYYALTNSAGSFTMENIAAIRLFPVLQIHRRKLMKKSCSS